MINMKLKNEINLFSGRLKGLQQSLRIEFSLSMETLKWLKRNHSSKLSATISV